MTKQEFKKLVDLIPFVILVISAIRLALGHFNQEYGYQWSHIFGFVLLPVNAYLFSGVHKIGVLGLGATIWLGVFGIISFSPAVVISSVFFNLFDMQIPVFYAQPIFLLWLAIHLVISGRQYIGIGTRKFWQDIAASRPAKSRLEPGEN